MIISNKIRRSSKKYKQQNVKVDFMSQYIDLHLIRL